MQVALGNVLFKCKIRRCLKSFTVNLYIPIVQTIIFQGLYCAINFGCPRLEFIVVLIKTSEPMVNKSEEEVINFSTNDFK